MQIQLAEVPDLAPLLEAIERGERVTVQKPDGVTVTIIKEPVTTLIEDDSRGFGSDRGKIWMSDDFDEPDFVMVYAPKTTRSFGLVAGQFWMSDDFDEPLEDFREYME